MKNILLAAMVLLTCCLCGCGTLITRIPSAPSTCYPATRYDGYIIASGGGIYAYGDCDNGMGSILGWSVVVPLHIVDLPISLITDTLLLPFDFRRSSVRNEEFLREFKLMTSVESTNAPGLLLTSNTRGSPALFQYSASGENTYAFCGDVLRPPGSTNSYKLIQIWDGAVILRKEKQEADTASHGAR